MLAPVFEVLLAVLDIVFLYRQWRTLFLAERLSARNPI